MGVQVTRVDVTADGRGHFVQKKQGNGFARDSPLTHDDGVQSARVNTGVFEDVTFRLKLPDIPSCGMYLLDREDRCLWMTSGRDDAFYLVQVDIASGSTTLRRLIPGRNGDADDLQFFCGISRSPDGKWLAVSMHREAQPVDGKVTLYDLLLFDLTDPNAIPLQITVPR